MSTPERIKNMNITELTNERMNEILSKLVGWFDDHYSDNELLCFKRTTGIK